MWNPESLTVSPNGLRMYVALLRRPHDPYWSGGHTNAIAEFDLVRQVKVKEFRVLADPYDLAVTDGGMLIASGGSDQWTTLDTYNTTNGARLASRLIRQLSRVSLHPSQRAVYTADTEGSPRDIKRYDFDLVTGAFLSSWDSPYYVEYDMGGNVWCHPYGTNVIVRGGYVFTSAASQSQDMRYQASLAGGVVEGAAFDTRYWARQRRCGNMTWLPIS
jgi:hypothetical protein